MTRAVLLRAAAIIALAWAFPALAQQRACDDPRRADGDSTGCAYGQGAPTSRDSGYYPRPFTVPPPYYPAPPQADPPRQPYAVPPPSTYDVPPHYGPSYRTW